MLFKEFYDEKGELKDTDHTIRDLFSNKNAPTIGKSTLRERYRRLLSNQNVLSSALPPPAIPIFPSVNNEPITYVCQSHEKGKTNMVARKEGHSTDQGCIASRNTAQTRREDQVSSRKNNTKTHQICTTQIS